VVAFTERAFAGGSGDLVSACGSTTGLVKNCKVGNVTHILIILLKLNESTFCCWFNHYYLRCANVLGG
jgi:hypothetical protein